MTGGGVPFAPGVHPECEAFYNGMTRLRQRSVQTLRPLTYHADKSGSDVDVQTQLRTLPPHGTISQILTPNCRERQEPSSMAFCH